MVLATDLDGTLIPIDGNSDQKQALADIKGLVQTDSLHLVFVTGRHAASAFQAINAFHLPWPDYLICNVGTEIFKIHERDPKRLSSYDVQLAARLPVRARDFAQEQLLRIGGLRLQEEAKQSKFKLSFYFEWSSRESLIQTVHTALSQDADRFSIVSSRDPFTGDGLLDLLPRGVDKSFALHWLCGERAWPLEHIIYAGDSGNDLAVFQSGIQGIMVGNATEDLRQACEGLSNVSLMKSNATSGVLEGLRNFTRQQEFRRD